jgi:alpha-galactosidase
MIMPDVSLSTWNISLKPCGIELAHRGALLWKGARPEIELSDGVLLQARDGKIDGTALVWDFGEGLMMRQEFSEADGWLRVATTLKNGTSQPLPLRQVRVFSGKLGVQSWERIFSQSNTMTGKIGIFVLKGLFESDSCVGFTDSAGTSAMVAGFEKLDEAFYQFRLEASSGELRIAPICLREGILLPPGGALTISPLLIGSGENLSRLLDDYAQKVASAMEARQSGETMTGWCSWYHYYGKERAGDILDNARTLAASPLRGKLKVIQIDDGWNRPSNDHPRVWGDWFPGQKFPQGMRAVADELHELGFQAGLWLAPFSVDKGSRLAAEHPDWIVRTKNEETGLLDPAGPGHVFGLDLTHPEVLAWLRTTFERVFHEWGFDYIKIDFLIHGVLPGERHDPGKTSAEAFRQGMQVIRECAGDSKFILNCGSPLGPSIGLCDAMRIGYDVGGRWDTPINLEQWPQGNCSIRAAAYPALFRQWMHRVWWQNDPDCLIVRDRAVSFEVEAISKHKTGMNAPLLGVAESDFGLSRNEAEFWVRAVWFTGGMNIVSEVWNELSPDRRDLLQRAFPPHPWLVRWLDCYEHPDVSVLETVEGPPMVGMFNLSEAPRTITFPRSCLAGSSTWTEWLSGEKLTLAGETASFPVLPPRSARIWVANTSSPDNQNLPLVGS